MDEQHRQGPVDEQHLTQNLKRGSYVFTFSATDDDGATASDQVAVTVRRP